MDTASNHIQANLQVDKEALATFCRKYNLQRLAFFGSVLRDDFQAESDVDVLVAYAPDCVPGLIALAGMEEELSAILGRKADIRSAGDLSYRFRNDVLREAQDQYVA